MHARGLHRSPHVTQERGAVVSTESAAPAKRTSTRVHVQKFGTFLSGMIMPNIAAFIAWGLVTALFIADGPFPVDRIGGFGAFDGARSEERRVGKGCMCWGAPYP